MSPAQISAVLLRFTSSLNETMQKEDEGLLGSYREDDPSLRALVERDSLSVTAPLRGWPSPVYCWDRPPGLSRLLSGEEGQMQGCY